MTSAERLVQTWVVSGREDEVNEMVQEISQNRITLLQVVKALGEYLTSDEDVLRSKGVDYLSLVIDKCPHDKINRQATRTLLLFYLNKLEETETVVPALKGLVSLVHLPTFLSTDVAETVNAIFAYVKMRSLTQPVRYSAYKIIDTLVARHRDALKSMGGSFIAGYTALADGEKDPRNLFLTFSIARVLCIEFDIAEHVEDIFNITFCYFPISFKAPTDDSLHITSDDLKRSLGNCLNATPAFGPLAMPLFLDKITAGAPLTKITTLETVSSCLPVYGLRVANQFAKDLWNLLKLEIFQSTNQDLEAAALETTQSLIKVLYPSDKPGIGTLEDATGLAHDICEECLTSLREPEKSQAIPAIKVLSALVASSPPVSKYTISETLPHILRLLRIQNEQAYHPQVLSLLSIFLDSICAVHTSKSASLPASLVQYKDELQSSIIIALSSEETTEPALACVNHLIRLGGLLSHEDLVLIVKTINDVVASDGEDTESIRDKAVEALTRISRDYSQIIQDYTLPHLFSSLPDQAPSREDMKGRLKCWRILRYLTKLCLEPSLFETFIVRLLTKVEFNSVPTKMPEEDADLEPTTAYVHAILKTIADAIDLKIAVAHLDIPKYMDRLVPRLLNISVHLALLSDKHSNVFINTKVMAVTCTIVTLVTQTASAEKQETFIKALTSAYLSGNVKAIAHGHYDIPDLPVFQPFNASAPSLQKHLVSLLAAGIIGLRKEVAIPFDDPPSSLSMILIWGVENAETDLQRAAARNIVASLVNKHASELADFIASCFATFWKDKVLNSEKSTPCRARAIDSWASITKALALQSHVDTSKYVSRLCELLDSPELSFAAARAVGAAGSGPDDVFSKRTHSVFRVLSMQKYFRSALAMLTTGAAEDLSNDSRCTGIVVAVVSLLRVMPKAIYTPELPKIMPYLLAALDYPDLPTRTDVLAILLESANDSDQVFLAQHSSALVNAMLRNSTATQSTTMQLRVAALNCLAVLPRILRYDILHPMRLSVIRELDKALDDRKRYVRKAAVDARTTW